MPMSKFSDAEDFLDAVQAELLSNLGNANETTLRADARSALYRTAGEPEVIAPGCHAPGL